jgi:hypothetical protein
MKVIGRASLTYEELSTIVVEVEGLINSRPLTYVFDDDETCTSSLCPSYLIYGRRITTIIIIIIIIFTSFNTVSNQPNYY